METSLIKPKRHRRTKKEMEAVREAQANALVQLTDFVAKSSKDTIKNKKSAQKSNMEEIEPILETTLTKISCIPKVKLETKQVEHLEGKTIEGWVNIYKEGKAYYTGTDIHSTVEDAKRIAGKSCIQQLQISFSVES